MTFNNISLEDKFTITDIRGRGILSNDIETIDVAGKAGAYFVSRKIPIRNIEIDIIIASDSVKDIRKDIRELNAILSVDEPKEIIFSDDEEIRYFGIPADSQENGEIVATTEATIVLVCADPFAYSDEKEHRFELDVTTLTNNGSEEAEPIFEFDVLAPITFAMIQNQENEYQMIGTPVNEDDNVEVIDTKESIMYENGSTLDQWNEATLDMVDEFFIDGIGGEMVFDGAGIRPNGFGTGEKMHGPAIIRELPRAIQDFEIETTFDIISNRESEAFRMVLYFYDEAMNNLGQLGIKDNSRHVKRRIALGRVGEYRGGGESNGNVIGDHSHTIENAEDTTLFYLRVRREGQKYSFYIGEWRYKRHDTVWEGTFHDTNNQWDGRLKYVSLFFGTHADLGAPGRGRFNSVEVYELKSITEDRTPYIADAGDIIIFDHQNGDLLINGESRKDIKDFGGQYFTLKKGENQLVLLPTDSLSATVTYRETHR
jgi:predicted phage tail component-like protein